MIRSSSFADIVSWFLLLPMSPIRKVAWGIDPTVVDNRHLDPLLIGLTRRAKLECNVHGPISWSHNHVLRIAATSGPKT